jgi:hypothetical protein
MEPSLLPPDFTSFGDDKWHCDLCHRLVRWYDTNDPGDAYDALLGHRAFNCTATSMIAAR